MCCRPRGWPGCASSRRCRATEVGDDLSVGDLVAARLGDEVVDRLVEPLLGGVYAGRARELSARAAVPQLVAMAARGSLLEQAATMPAVDGPVFAGVAGGLHRLTDTLAASGRFTIRTGATVRELARDGRRLPAHRRLGPRRRAARRRGRRARHAGRPDGAAARATSLPPRPASWPRSRRRPSPWSPWPTVRSTRRWRRWPGRRRPASWCRPSRAGRSRPRRSPSPSGTGSARPVATWWCCGPRWAGTASRPRSRRPTTSSSPARAPTSPSWPASRASPSTAHVQRWGGGLPQYALGHVDRVARIRAEVARVPGLAVCGAAYDGVGIPAVIASARAAAEQVAADAQAAKGTMSP